MQIITKESKSTFAAKNGETKHYTNYYLQCANGKLIQFRCAYSDDYRVLQFLANNGAEYNLYKKQSTNTYVNTKGVTCHYYNYFIGVDDKLIQIRANFVNDYSLLDVLCFYVK